jgi:hypothetical protein
VQSVHGRQVSRPSLTKAQPNSAPCGRGRAAGEKTERRGEGDWERITDTSRIHGHRRNRARKNSSLRPERSELGGARFAFLLCPLGPRSKPALKSRDEIAGERSEAEPPWRHPRASSSPRPTPRQHSSGYAAAAAAAPWGWRDEAAGARAACGLFDAARRTSRPGPPRGGSRRRRRRSRTRRPAATLSRSPPASSASSPASPSCYSTSRYGTRASRAHLRFDRLVWYSDLRETVSRTTVLGSAF